MQPPLGQGVHDPFAIVDNDVTIGSEYVNMADINVTAFKQRRPTQDPDAEPIWDVIELLFFAYRDFVGDPDEVLAKFGLAGRTTGCFTLSIAIPA